MADDYASYLEERYQGEVYGEAVMRALAEVASDPLQAHKLRHLEQLERETKELLLPEVEATGGETRESAEKIAEAEKLGAQFGQVPWSDRMRAMTGQLEKYVADFRRCEALAPPGKEALLKHVTAHEQALLDFANRELAGSDPEHSLAPVVALLREVPGD
ncbi:MAG: hypothetical protein JRH16_11710 [Deltaproteobacteria bacterium]|nr:hypothetical protein [Deltaproteobacteria bacterium]MBW2362254.1 hypothetical protein [Deltaproteobacteria bacterium]